jgi:hypothetical protein
MCKPNSLPQTDLTHINILAELYCDGGLWAEALAVVEGAERKLLGPDEELPIDLTVGGWIHGAWVVELTRAGGGGCRWPGGSARVGDLEVVIKG